MKLVIILKRLSAYPSFITLIREYSTTLEFKGFDLKIHALGFVQGFDAQIPCPHCNNSFSVELQLAGE